MDCAGRPDFAHGLHTEGFVYVNVPCVVIVLVIVVVCNCVMDMFGSVGKLDYISFKVAGTR